MKFVKSLMAAALLSTAIAGSAFAAAKQDSLDDMVASYSMKKATKGVEFTVTAANYDDLKKLDPSVGDDKVVKAAKTVFLHALATVEAKLGDADAVKAYLAARGDRKLNFEMPMLDEDAAEAKSKDAAYLAKVDGFAAGRFATVHQTTTDAEALGLAELYTPKGVNKVSLADMKKGATDYSDHRVAAGATSKTLKDRVADIDAEFKTGDLRSFGAKVTSLADRQALMAIIDARVAKAKPAAAKYVADNYDDVVAELTSDDAAQTKLLTELGKAGGKVKEALDTLAAYTKVSKTLKSGGLKFDPAKPATLGAAFQGISDALEAAKAKAKPGTSPHGSGSDTDSDHDGAGNVDFI